MSGLSARCSEAPEQAHAAAILSTAAWVVPASPVSGEEPFSELGQFVALFAGVG
jgi:hypothetical protein